MADDSISISKLLALRIPSFKDAIPALLDLGLNAERTNETFMTMTGSAAAAKRTLQELDSLATRSSYGREEIIETGQALLEAGVEADDVALRLSDIANVAAATHQPLKTMASLFGSVRKNGKAMSADLDAFAKQGVPIYETLADILKMNTDEVRAFADQGNVTYDVMKQAFSAMGSEGGTFGNAMAVQMQTVDGYYKMLENNAISLKETLGSTMWEALEPVQNLGMTLLSLVLPAVTWVKGHFDLLKGVLQGLAIVITGVGVAWKTYETIQRGVAAATFLLTRGKQLLRIASLQLQIGVQALGRAFMANPIGFIVAAIMGLVTVLAMAWESSETFRGVVLGIWEVLKLAWDAVVSVAKAVWDWGLIFVAVRAYIRIFGDIFSWLWSIIQDVFGRIKRWIMDTFGAAIEWITNSVKKLFNWLLSIADKIGLTDTVAKIRQAFAIGFEKGKDPKKEEEKEKPAVEQKETPPPPDPKADKLLQEMTLNGIANHTRNTRDTTRSGIVGVKNDPPAAKSITINIDKFVESFTVSTTNLKEGASDVRQVILETFADAVRDFETSYN